MTEVPIIQKLVKLVMDWFLHDTDLRHESVKLFQWINYF